MFLIVQELGTDDFFAFEESQRAVFQVVEVLRVCDIVVICAIHLVWFDMITRSIRQLLLFVEHLTGDEGPS